MKAPSRPSKSETLATAIEQDYAHQHSSRVIARRSILQYTLKQIEQEMVNLNAAMAKAKKAKFEIEAKIVGLSRILGKR